MLLTIPWVGGLILGRVDIINKQGVDNKCSKLELSSLWKSVSMFIGIGVVNPYLLYYRESVSLLMLPIVLL